jgi:hypothetical protein
MKKLINKWSPSSFLAPEPFIDLILPGLAHKQRSVTEHEWIEEEEEVKVRLPASPAKRTVIVPENLNLDQLFKDHKPKGFRPSIDRLYYLVGLLAEIPARDRRIGQTRENPFLGFIPLYSQILKPKIHNYQLYLEYLIAAGVIECDNQYIVGGKSKGYRLSSNYRTAGRLQSINETSLLGDTRNHKDSLQNDHHVSNQLGYLRDIKIDSDAAMAYLISSRTRDINSSPNAKRGEIHIKYNSHLAMLKNFVEHDFYIVKDKFSGRLHSNLTNLKSEYRQFLTFKNSELAAIDLSNTMALSALSLLRLDFYSDDHSDLATFKNINPETLYDLKFFDISSDKYLYSIMCGTYKTPAIEEEFTDFTNAVTSGKFYETMAAHFHEHYGLHYSIEQIKNLMFLVLYCRPDESRESILFKKLIFDDLYPTIGRILDGWRNLAANNLPMLLQRIEAHIFLDCMLPKITEKCGDIPIFTVHDSIVTLVDFVDVVEETMHEVIREKTGVSCYLKTELWAQNQ